MTAAAFLPALKAGFVNFDDDKIILGTKDFRALSWSNIQQMFGTFYGGKYQPLSYVTYALDHRLWGLNPTGYHLTSLLLHAANAALFYLLSLGLLRLVMPQTKVGMLRLAAGFSALLFGVHPLRVESAAWISERGDVLSGFFYLLTLIAYLKAQSGSGGQGSRRLWLALAIAVFPLSLLSKGIGISIPLTLILLDIYPLERLGWDARAWLEPAKRAILLEKVPFFLLALILGAVGYIAQDRSGVVTSLHDYGLGQRLAQSGYGLIFYLGKTLFPIHLVPLYRMPHRIDLLYWPFTLSALLVLAISGGLILLRHRWRAGIVLWGFYVVTLLPVLGLVQFGPQITADRYTYLSCLGWAALAGGCLASILARKNDSWHRSCGLTAAGLLVVISGCLCWRQTAVWHDSESLWRYSLSVDPTNATAHFNLGSAVMEKTPADAITRFKEALILDPHFAEARYNLGNTLGRQGLLDQAVSEYRMIPSASPYYMFARFNAGIILYNQGKLDGSIRAFEEASHANPNNALAFINWGAALVKQGKVEEGIGKYKKALNIDPSLVLAYYNWGAALMQEGKFDEAVYPYQQILKQDPSSQQARDQLSALLRHLGAHRTR
ncbi:MAG: tetratricopeptide repeat protein [Elusimicrobia bacterium]|nr:tetratricopeptide repeat protein [Elusimicrobiota bacterium]